MNKTLLVLTLAVVISLSLIYVGSNESQIMSSTTQSQDNPDNLQDVLNHCDLQRKFFREDIPLANAKETTMILDPIPISHSNSTHYIDNIICKWKQIDQDKTTEFNKLLFMTCPEIVKRNTDGGQYETKENREFAREKVSACSNPEEFLAAIGSCEQNYERYTNGKPYLFEDHQNMAQGTLIGCIVDGKLLIGDLYDYDDFFANQLKPRLLEYLQNIPRTEHVQKITDSSRDFVISEAIHDQEVSDLLSGQKYQVNCCTFVADKNDKSLNRYVGLTFDIPEKYLSVVVTYDLADGKISVGKQALVEDDIIKVE